MTIRTVSAFVFLLLLTHAAWSQSRSAAHVITPEMMKPHLKFLADDALEGRETGENGLKVAARYMASVYERLGLKPGANDGSFFQRFPLYKASVRQSMIAVKTKDETQRLGESGKDFYIAFTAKDTSILSVACVGYGIDDTAAFKYSDFLGHDVEGKAVLAFAGVPGEGNPSSPFKGKTKWHASGQSAISFAKITAARRAGASALILVFDGSPKELEAQAKRSARFSEGRLSRQPGRASRNPFTVVVVSTEVADALLARTGITVKMLRKKIDETLQPSSMGLDGVALTIIHEQGIDTVWTENVIAKHEGSDPRLKEEAIVISAHYDHLGMNDNGEVYNGADDDGSGTTALLAIAEAISKSKKKPKRSLYFIGFAGEEKGLLGSSYYAEDPVVPLKKTMANLNIDMIGRSDTAHTNRGQARYTYVIGSDKISDELDEILQRTNKRTLKYELDYIYNDENDPNQFYRRSDHYNFARNDVPIIFFFTGVHEDYHRTTDDVEKIDFVKMSEISSLIYHVALELANKPGTLRRKPEAKLSN